MPPQTDPWVEAAKSYKPQGGGADAPTGANEDWKLWQQSGEPAQSEPLMQTIGTGIKDLGVGAGKGLLHTISGTDEWARQHLPSFLTNSNMGFGKPADLEHVKQMATPQGAMQKTGYGGEQVGEFMLPGGAEKRGAAKLAEFAPKLGKYAEPLAHMATSALSSGAVNKAQGGDFTTGAALGAGGQAIGQGMKAMAPALAESALNIRKLDRAYGKSGGSIGRAVLDETKGIRPGTVAESAEQRLGELNPQLNAAADRVTDPVASMAPARNVLSAANDTATRQGERTTAVQLQPMTEHLSETMSGNPIPEDVTPRQLLDLKRGYGNEFIHRWNPETMTGVKGTAAKTYHAMADEFNRTVPEAEGLNSRISNLIPVSKRASSLELNAPTMQRAVNRFAAHTGALTGAGIGGTLGYREGGLPGAVAGGLTGVLAPELIASPEGEMATARLLNKTSALKPAVGAAAQFTRKKDGE